MAAGCSCARAARSRSSASTPRRPTPKQSKPVSAPSRTSWASRLRLVSDLPAVKRAEETIVEKPWGYEVRWAITERYLGKILHVKQGEALSLQYHERKDECILLSSGVLDLELDGEVHRLQPGDTAHITPGTRHRMTAVEDCDIFEVSTPEINDVVRLE